MTLAHTRRQKEVCILQGTASYEESAVSSLSMPLTPLPIVPPTHPNFGRCDEGYGDRLSIRECLQAGAQLPINELLVSYRVAGQVPADGQTPFDAGNVNEPYVLPWAGVVG